MSADDDKPLPPVFDFRAIVNTRAAKRADRIRSALGTPTTLAGWREAKPPSWLVEGFLQRGALTMLSAVGGAGKSLVLQDLALRLAAGIGGSWLGAFPITATGPLNVVLIEAENGTARLCRRARELVLGGALTDSELDAATDNLVIYGADGLGHRELVLEALPDVLADASFDVLLIDPLRAFLPASVETENDNVSVGRVADRLVRLALDHNVAVLVADHDNRNGGALRGASSKADAAVFVAHVEPVKDDPALVAVTMVKQRDPGGVREVRVRRVSLPKTPDGLLPFAFQRDEAAEVEAQAKATGKNPAAVLDERDCAIVMAVLDHYAATHGGMSIRAIGEATGVSKSRVQARVAHLVGLGALYRPDDKAPVYPPAAKPEATC